MKKFLCFFLILLFLLSGCQQSVDNIPQTVPLVTKPAPIEEVTTPQPEETVQETEPTVYAQMDMYAISMPLQEIDLQGGSDTPLFHHRYQDMHIITQEPEVADRIILDYLNRMDALQRSLQSIHIADQGQSNTSGFTITGNVDFLFSTTRIDRSVLSLCGAYTVYSDQSRPSQNCIPINYDMLTGDVLTLGSILYRLDAKDQLVDLAIAQADSIAQEAMLFDDYPDTIRERFQQDESFDMAWYMTNTGLCFYFLPYEIAPYSSGVVTLEIPYDALTGVIADEFFPPEEDVFIGTILTQPLEKADLSQFNQIAEVILDDEGQMYFLSAQGAVHDVRIEMGIGSVEDIFSSTCTVFATSHLTPGDGVMIQFQKVAAPSSLRITYRSGDAWFEEYL